MALTCTSASRGRFFFWSFRRGLEVSPSSRAEGAEVKEKILETLASLSEELDHGNRDVRLSFFVFFFDSGLSASDVSGSVLSAEVV
jgi:hypothetical protein